MAGDTGYFMKCISVLKIRMVVSLLVLSGIGNCNALEVDTVREGNFINLSRSPAADFLLRMT